MSRNIRLPISWYQALSSEFALPYWRELGDFVEREYAHSRCFPDSQAIFRALELTPLSGVKVVILGQDPYHTPGAAMGLAFSIPHGLKPQPSLSNIFQELATDVGYTRQNTDLTDWAEQGVLLLNTVLTVREGQPASHQKQGWERFTDAVIQSINHERSGVVFILWGSHAIAKKSLIDTTRHHIITSPHPSPLSAYRGFFGSRPFSRTNTFFRSQGIEEIIW